MTTEEQLADLDDRMIVLQHEIANLRASAEVRANNLPIAKIVRSKSQTFETANFFKLFRRFLEKISSSFRRNEIALLLIAEAVCAGLSILCYIVLPIVAAMYWCLTCC